MTSTLAVARAFLVKEYLDLGRRRLVLSLYVGLPLLFSLLPLLFAASSRGLRAAESRSGEAGAYSALLATAQEVPELRALAPEDAVLLFLLRQTGILLVIVPVVLTTHSGASSLVGEKTERTLEPLLATPLRDAQLLVGKLVALGLPAVLATLAGGLVGAALTDAVLWPRFHRLVLPDAAWALTLFLLVPLAAALGLLVALRVSARSTDVQSAQQLAGLVAAPLALLVVVALVRPLLFNVWLLPLAAAGLLALDAALFLWSLARFNREEILTRWR